MVRRELAAILTPTDTSTKATQTHEALLILSQRRDGKFRLVTTNFDRLFQEVIERRELKVSTCQAPLLQVPKNRLNGLVYLHGLLPPVPDDDALDCLVVSSGDFGLAYLTERWAARFASELFRHYTVCFVGYSLDDPVLRYMMDALAADRQRGEAPLEMYIFGSYTTGKEAVSEAEWHAKNVTPILYKLTKDHRYLHKTLRRWSEIYRDGSLGKELIIIKEAISNPLIRTREDDFVSRVLWALSDESGLPAKRFAELTPAPSLEWLEALSENRYGHADLVRFGVLPKSDKGTNLAFSLTRRPSPYHLAPLMGLCEEETSSNWDTVMTHLAHWLTRHLDDPALILWLAKRGGRLNHRFAGLVDQQLERIAQLERDGSTEELDRLRVTAPRAVPRPILRTVWRLLLSGRVQSDRDDLDLHDWARRFRRDGLSPSLRQSLRELLTPCILLRDPVRWSEEIGDENEPQRLKEILGWEVKLRTSSVQPELVDLTGSPQWESALPDLLPDFNILLRDALDLMHELGSAEERSDTSYVYQPSISEHPQNQNFYDWTMLIELTRDAWLALAHQSVEQARLVAQQWEKAPYPLFKRLAFFAAAQRAIVPTSMALDWLLADDGWWLWTVETKREALRLMVTLAPQLDQDLLARLEETILTGPPRSMYRAEPQEERWHQIVDREVWLRLIKVTSSGAPLGEKAQAARNTLTSDYPLWQLEEGERDEFPFWMGSDEEWRKAVVTPKLRRELIDWLKQPSTTDSWQEDDWGQRCRNDFATTACALYALSQENFWPEVYWREALQAWSGEERLRLRSWRYIAPVLDQAPEEVIRSLVHSVSWWLEALAKSFVSHQDLFFALCGKILSIDYQDEDRPHNTINRAINHPVGMITEALLRWWHRDYLEDNHGLPDKLEPIFTQLCDSPMLSYRHARVLLAARAITLFRVDPAWTKQHLLPHFDWSVSPVEAAASWNGFLWSPRLYTPLFDAIKPMFLHTASLYENLGYSGRQYAALLTFTALEFIEIFTAGELKAATDLLPEAGRLEVVRTLILALEGAGDQRAEYWRNRIHRYWKSIWPKSRTYRTQALAKEISRLCISAGDAFPEALNILRPWLLPLDSNSMVHSLEEAKLSSRYPAAALDFLSLVVDANMQWPPHDIGKSLDNIKAAQPDLVTDRRFRRLMELRRRYE